MGTLARASIYNSNEVGGNDQSVLTTFQAFLALYLAFYYFHVSTYLESYSNDTACFLPSHCFADAKVQKIAVRSK